MKVFGIVVIVLLVIGVGIITTYLWHVRDDDQRALPMESPVPLPQTASTSTIQKGKPVFEWSYESFERNTIPSTTISITSSYPNGSVESKAIDTIEGSCNEYAERDPDTYPDSDMIICYYAGLGRYYKIVEQQGRYAVQRKIFEEASPDYEPPVQHFETIAQF